MLLLVRQFPQNLRKIFSGNNLLWHLLAILLTVIIVFTGFDWFYFKHFRSWSLNPAFFAAVVIGGLLPFILPVMVLLWGHVRGNKNIKVSAWAIGQAEIMASLVVAAYKFFTGRVQPNLLNLTKDISHQFLFGFDRHGVFWGWPSSHTAVAFAMALTVIVLFPSKKWLAAIVLCYAFYIDFGVSISIHWFSEFVAGAIIGSVVGYVVGGSYRELFRNNS